MEIDHFKQRRIYLWDSELWVFCNAICQKPRNIYVVPFLPHELHNSTGLSYVINIESESTCRYLKVLRQWVGRMKCFCLEFFSFNFFLWGTSPSSVIFVAGDDWVMLYPTAWERELSFLENSAVLLIASGKLQDSATSTLNQNERWNMFMKIRVIS